MYSFYHSKFFSTLDVPNHRSMHEYPTKKSAGLVFIGNYMEEASVNATQRELNQLAKSQNQKRCK